MFTFLTLKRKRYFRTYCKKCNGVIYFTLQGNRRPASWEDDLVCPYCGLNNYLWIRDAEKVSALRKKGESPEEENGQAQESLGSVREIDGAETA